MRAFIAEANAKGKAPVLQRAPNREWAGDMPRIRATDASRRTMKEFMETDGAKRALKARGVSKTAAQKAVSAEARSRGVSERDFSMLSRASQQAVFKASLKRRKPTDGETRRSKMKPINDALYNSQKNYVERHGGTVLRGGEEVERHLDAVHADVAHLGGIIFLREDANTSEVLEEVFHFQQEQRGDYAEDDETIGRLLRERDAQNYLIGVARRYNIPESETRHTKHMLEWYLQQLKEAGFDESD